MPEWIQLSDVDRAHAQACLLDGEDVRPYLTVFAGPELLFTAGLAAFERGDASVALRQLRPLARALGTDRLVFSSMAWVQSMDDAPAPPWSRRPTHVFQSTLIDHHGDQRRAWSRVQPYDVVRDANGPLRVTWGQEHVLDHDEPLIGASNEVLGSMLEPMNRPAAGRLRRLLGRAEERGHLLGVGPTVLGRLFPDDEDVAATVAAYVAAAGNQRVSRSVAGTDSSHPPRRLGGRCPPPRP